MRAKPLSYGPEGNLTRREPHEQGGGRVIASRPRYDAAQQAATEFETGGADHRGSDAAEDFSPESDAWRAESELISYKDALNRHAIVAVTDARGVIVNANDRFCEISQYSRTELIARTHAIVNSKHHPREFFAELWKTILSGQVWHGDVCNRSKDGSLYWVDTTVAPKRNARRSIVGYVSIGYDITKRKLAEAHIIEESARREKAESLLRDVLESLPDAVTAFGPDDKLILYNRALLETYSAAAPVIREGLSYAEFVQHAVEQRQFVLSRDTSSAREAWIAARIRDHRNPGQRVVQQLSSGRWVQFQERRSPNGHVVGVRTDITELKRAEDAIRRQAECDPLTGIFNRRAFLERLERALASTPPPGGVDVLVVADLDGFKAVNDAFGHGAGDEVLIRIAERLRKVTRKSDVAARLGGDEFALILRGLPSENEARKLVKRLIATARRPIRFGAQTIACGATFGAALLHRDGETPGDLLKYADMALYEAKARGRGTYRIFDPGLRERVDRRNVVVEALRAAISRGEIDVALQPQVGFANGRHSGFEALARWQIDGKPVAPAEFIPAAEEAGLIVDLGRQVLEKSLSVLRSLRKKRLETGPVAVNVAAAQLRHEDFVRTVRSFLSRFGLEPQDLEIEVTENVLLDRAGEEISASLKALHDLGVQIALDDFGTGFASLSHLQRFPVSRLKIDRAFVHGLDEQGSDAIITRTIINLAHSLGMKAVAEGVETEEQYRLLSNFGCDFAQGFLINRPLPINQIEKYLTTETEAAFAGPGRIPRFGKQDDSLVAAAAE